MILIFFHFFSLLQRFSAKGQNCSLLFLVSCKFIKTPSFFSAILKKALFYRHLHTFSSLEQQATYRDSTCDKSDNNVSSILNSKLRKIYYRFLFKIQNPMSKTDIISIILEKFPARVPTTEVSLIQLSDKSCSLFNENSPSLDTDECN